MATDSERIAQLELTCSDLDNRLKALAEILKRQIVIIDAWHRTLEAMADHLGIKLEIPDKPKFN